MVTGAGISMLWVCFVLRIGIEKWECRGLTDSYYNSPDEPISLSADRPHPVGAGLTVEWLAYYSRRETQRNA